MSTAALTSFAWNESYSVKIHALDSQHKRLVDLIAQLQEARAEGRVRETLGRILAELILYTEHHFATEERLLELHGYPDLTTHKAIHAAFTQKVLDFQSRFASGKVVLSVQMMRFLRGWLIGHIQGIDMNYSEFLNAKGMR